MRATIIYHTKDKLLIISTGHTEIASCHYNGSTQYMI